MHIQTVIFDLGGVLIDWNTDYLFRSVIPDPDRRQFFYDHICPYSWNLEQDAGKPFAVATEERVALFPEWETEIRAYYGRWTETISGAIDGTVDILRALIADPNYQVLALTNWSAESYPVAQSMFEFLGWFEGVVVSGEEKTRKPFPEIYKILLDRYHVEAHKAVFIDDSLPNIEMGRSLGIHGIHFQSPAQLKVDLAKMGVIV